jgi:uncharacterized membrane protein YdjX (TVP38/TMEM64 family)
MEKLSIRFDPGVIRLTVIPLSLIAAILIPFALWSEPLNSAASSWLNQSHQPLTLALLGVTLLILDVLLPIPSSVVSMALCWMLGPVWGAAAVFVGMTGAFGLGYGLGRLTPRSRLRAWVGPALWDAMFDRSDSRLVFWITLGRPIPVLAELTAMLAGVFRIPLRQTLPAAVLSSLGVSCMYAASAWLGQQQVSFWWTLAASIGMPSVMWGAYRLWRVRLLAKR